MPDRIRLSRAPGWRMPPDTVSIARPSKWGNPFKVGALAEIPEPDSIPPQPHTGNLADGVQGVRHLAGGSSYLFTVRRVWNRADAVALFIQHARAVLTPAGVQSHLAGKNLACWCPLPAPGEPDICHGAPLLALAAGRRMTSPDVPKPGGGTIVKVQRCCNGCGQRIGDVTTGEILCAITGEPMPDVRHECPTCSPGASP